MWSLLPIHSRVIMVVVLLAEGFQVKLRPGVTIPGPRSLAVRTSLPSAEFSPRRKPNIAARTAQRTCRHPSAERVQIDT